MRAPPLTGPTVRRHRSEQDVATPDDFRRVVMIRFGVPDCDVAASPSNAFALKFFTKEQDALKQTWPGGLLWLNPPFGDLDPWAAKCHVEAKCGARILLLVPASVGSNWFAKHIFHVADVYFLRPRLMFKGHDKPYPKDLMLCWFHPLSTGSIECWKWK